MLRTASCADPCRRNSSSNNSYGQMNSNSNDESNTSSSYGQSKQDSSSNSYGNNS